MKIPGDKKATIIILLTLVLLFVLKGIDFIRTRQAIDLSLVQQQIRESFVEGVTRLTDCQCLPGYIPYKTTSGTIVCRNTIDGSTTKSCF
jgi:hypothetical protein